MNQLQKAFKYLKERKRRTDNKKVIEAVGSYSADRRVSQLLNLGLVEKRVIDISRFIPPLTEYKITELGLQTSVFDVRVPSKTRTPKVKKTRAESEVKKQCKEYIPRIYPTTFVGKIKYIWSEIKFLFLKKGYEKHN